MPFAAPRSALARALTLTEILEAVAFYLCTSTFLGPPAAIVPLLVASREFNMRLSYPVNPTLYARIFAAKFDVAAIIRRSGPGCITAACRADELRRRCSVLRRMRQIVNAQDFWSCEEDAVLADLCSIYQMCLESDGNNRQQLLEYGHLRQYALLYVRKEMLPFLARGLLSDTLERALAMWLLWFSTTKRDLLTEDAATGNAIMALLRPFVFANFKYDPFYAPWTYFRLPLYRGPTAVPPLPQHITHGPRIIIPALQTHQLQPSESPHHTDLQLRDRTQYMWAYNRKMPFCPPLLAQAALLLFSMRIQRGPLVGERPEILPPLQAGAPAILHGVKMRTAHLTDSRAYDRHCYRAATCINPFSSEVPPRCTEPGMLSGVWEGRSVILDLGQYRRILAGETALLSTAMAAQQPVLWSITEHHFHPAPSRADKSAHPYSPHSDILEDVSGYWTLDGEDEHGDAEWIQTSLKEGPALNAYFPLGSRVVPFDKEGVAVTVPGQPSVYYKTWNGPEWEDAKDHFAFEKDEGGEDKMNEGWVPKRAPYDPIDDSNEDEWDQELNDIILTGGPPESHHSSTWDPPFTLMGRIRSWDGMIIILRESDGPMGKVRWLFRGYLTPCGNWIGRWRETGTPEYLCGYEGTFCLTRKPSA
ncbi:hypothetical protein BOTBODRAFT_43836 [Botryobasidium botryosum FD-172 SS1]|uniref:F-box domain-containing protein n=1 Tax=Botryobasidium botryosum (strain FD-172 SS1) TaxID=930990 RepID=A0A067MVN6_BOTB1|nr:hypothetical protein BOTBODRAFT_43836 [Botryobasidium botryosum FD-172 SS1]